MANTCGGVIVAGVRENSDKTHDSIGLTGSVDKEAIHKKVRKYLPSVLCDLYDIQEFFFEETEYPKIKGKKFQVMLINYDPSHLPFLAKQEGTGIKRNAIYVRKGTSSTEADHDDVQKIINARIDTGYSSTKEISLKEHIEQLRVLYEEIPKSRYKAGGMMGLFMTQLRAPFGQEEPNPDYPEESIDKFLARMVDKKKKRIERELDVSSGKE